MITNSLKLDSYLIGINRSYKDNGKYICFYTQTHLPVVIDKAKITDQILLDCARFAYNGDISFIRNSRDLFGKINCVVMVGDTAKRFLKDA